MTIINGVIGGIGAVLISYGTVLALAVKNRDSLKVDAEQVRAIDEGGAADAEWVEEIRDGANKGLVSPSVANAASSTCGFSEQDLADIVRSFKFWGGNETGRLDTGCSDWLLATCLVGGTAAGAIGGATEGVLFGFWVATFVGICVNDFRYRRIDLAAIALLALLGVFMGGPAGIGSRLIQGLVLSAVLYLASLGAELFCGREAFGLGDVLLLGAVGASAVYSTAALSAACLALFAECAVALAILKARHSDTALPFAPLALLPSLAFVLVA